MSSIEEDIKILESMLEEYENCSVPEIDMQVDVTFGKKQANAIKTLLGNLEALCDMQRSADRELKRQKQINEEHKKLNGELREKVKELEKYTIHLTDEEFRKVIENAQIDTSNDRVIAHKFAIMQQQINEKDKKIQELELKLKCSKDLYDDCCKCLLDSIPKQVVIDKVNEINKKYEDSKDENGESPYYYPDYTVRVLQGFLGEK